MPAHLPIKHGRDRHAAALAAPRALGPLEPVPVRIREHILELRSRLAFGIAVDASHGSPVSIERTRYLRELERAVASLDSRNVAALRTLWSGARAAATHDPVTDPRLGSCPRCDLIERVRRRPGEAVPPGRLTHPPVGPPPPHAGSVEEQTRLPRVRNMVALELARTSAHGDEVESLRATRVLTSIERRLVRDHLDLSLAAVGQWAVLEASWARNPSLVHDGCALCWAEEQQRAAH